MSDFLGSFPMSRTRYLPSNDQFGGFFLDSPTSPPPPEIGHYLWTFPDRNKIKKF